MFSAGVENQLRQDIDAAVAGDIDARSFILKVGRNTDVPDRLGDSWARSWNIAALIQLAGMTQAQRQDHIYDRMRAFMHDDVANRIARVDEAATQTRNAELQLQGLVARALLVAVVAFNSDVLERTHSPFTQKVKYNPLTDIDVETARAIIEVTTQKSASGKLTQLQTLRGAAANPQGKPVFHLMPNATAKAVIALTAAGSSGVFRTIPDLQAAISALP